jgi:hypothetical protein
METAPSPVVKAYSRRGPLQQFRLASSAAFRCFRCGESKKSKLIAVYADDWSWRLCNGCYGLLLSIHEIKAGTGPEDERAERLAELLQTLVSLDDRRTAERMLIASDARTKFLLPETMCFLATAEYLADKLTSNEHLEWSPSIIGLCKAVELEVISRIVLPLAQSLGGIDLSSDQNDKDMGRLAKFCASQIGKPPELGTFAHFLSTAVHSRARRGSSALIRKFLELANEWTGSHWILDPDGLHCALKTITLSFRNRAAHIDQMTEADYRECRELVMGSEGVLWKLVTALERHR